MTLARSSLCKALYILGPVFIALWVARFYPHFACEKNGALEREDTQTKMVMFYIGTAAVVTLLYNFAKTHQIVSIKVVNFVFCKSYLNKADYEKETSQIYE